ncbi:hypothetical protein EZV73_04165 [Acidaminobacter sp. JC074]|uniref:hypothetical protein n=1 Tax=Acidaminobacter sp. JC074 TaxID=2530199 RepID=UPI001F0F0843|nr:hypothetical protein [Acidaminobacter sp. JC074]MCH4886747.1 hypothetical protein [Acidaminobacter sp. JC074]
MKRKHLIIFAVFLLIFSVAILSYAFYEEEDHTPKQAKLNAFIPDKEIIEALGIKGDETNTDTQTIETTIDFNVRRDKISGQGYFTLYGSKVYVDASGEYRTYALEGFVDFYSGRLKGVMDINGHKWDIVLNYSDYDGHIKYVIGVQSKEDTELFSAFKFNNYSFEPGLLEGYKLKSNHQKK